MILRFSLFKKRIILYAVLITVIFIIVLSKDFKSCLHCVFDNRTGSPEISTSIKDSKQNGLFKYKYYFPKKEIRINDTINFIIEDAWLEKTWYYDLEKCHNKLIVPNNYQLVIKIKDFGINSFYNEIWDLRLLKSKQYVDAEENGIGIRNMDIENDTIELIVSTYKIPFHERTFNNIEGKAIDTLKIIALRNPTYN